MKKFITKFLVSAFALADFHCYINVKMMRSGLKTKSMHSQYKEYLSIDEFPCIALMHISTSLHLLVKSVIRQHSVISVR